MCGIYILLYRNVTTNNDFVNPFIFIVSVLNTTGNGKFLTNRKEPEPPFEISAPAPGGNFTSATRLSASAPQHCV